MIRLGGPTLGEKELKAVERVLASGQLVQAAEVAGFETALAEHLGAPVVAVSSGTAALHLALLSLGVRAGDLVVVPTFSWPATANIVEVIGAQSVFVDIDPGDFNIDPDALDETLARLCKVKETSRRLCAVIVVHAFGAIGNMDRISAICRDRDVPLIEDAACALGSTLGGRPPGSWGKIACLSFHPRKLLTTAEGGALICSDADCIARLKTLRNHGLDPLSGTPSFVLPGLNYRMSEVHAAIGRCQLTRLAELVNERRRRAFFYNEKLPALGVKPQAVRPDCHHNLQSYVVTLPVSNSDQRNHVIDAMRLRDIETTIGTWHIPLTAYYRTRYGYHQGDFPITDRIFSQTLTLPLSVDMTEADQAMVISALGEALSGPDTTAD
jgi:dTDP-4-amino-4,6-dideoxygalactose transaminase